MKFIILGSIDRRLWLILVGGIGKLIAELILYFYRDDIKINIHPFISGINASMGMILAIIPHIYMKCKSKNDLNKIDEAILFKNSMYNIRKKSILSKRQLTIIIIFLCCILDYIQKILTFLYSQYIINNLWIFDIIFLGLFSLYILKIKLYSHQYLSCLIMISFGIVLNAIDVEYNVELIYKLLLSFLIEICYNLAVVLAKYAMDNLFLTPYEISFYEGIFAFIVNTIFLAISTNSELVDPPLLIKLMKSCQYKGKTYLDNFYAYWEEFKNIEILCFILEMIGRSIFNIFGHIIAKDFTPSHVIFLLMLGELFLSFKDFDAKKIASIFIILVELFMLLIFTEIIELNFCNLNYNTKRNIRKREEKITEMDEKSDDSGILLGENIRVREQNLEETKTFYSISNLSDSL